MLYCKGLKNRGLHKVSEGYQGLADIFKIYLDSSNEIICSRLDVDSHYPIVGKVLKAIAKEKLKHEQNLDIEHVHKIISDCLPELGVNAASIYRELISESLLSEYVYDDKTKVFFSYDRYYSIIAAKILLEEELKKYSNIKEAFKKSKKIKKQLEYNQGLSNALAILIPDEYGVEFVDVVPDKGSMQIKRAFLHSLKWRRKASLIFNRIRDYINDEIVPYNWSNDELMCIFLLHSSEPEHPLNSDRLHHYLSLFSMPERDAYWSVFIHNQYNEYEKNNIVRVLIEWGEKHPVEYLSDESIRLFSQGLLWFLTSSNRTLRDCATKSLINILKDRINVLCVLIDKFNTVNDPYVVQRLYAVAFGCAVRCEKDEDLLMLCEKVYEKVFSIEDVVADILLRDYAKNVIEYGKFRNLKFEFDISKIFGPFKSILPNNLPTSEDIKKLMVPYEECEKDPRKRGMNQIIRSMKTNQHSVYGDFGRYTWENAFNYWNVDVHGLNHYAIKMIFEEYGYDYSLLGEFDNSVSSYDRQPSQVERIGKKYQWIAFFNLLARVADNCEVKRNAFDGENREVKYVGTFEPYVRDIDPTILLTKSVKEGLAEQLDESFWNEENLSWMKSKSNLPDPVRFICRKDNNEKEWLSLGEKLVFKQPLKLGEKNFYHGQKELHYWLNAYIVKKSEFSKIKKWAKNKNFFLRWMPENRECFEIFDKEYYWSDAFYSLYGSELWSNLLDVSTIVGRVGTTCYQYFWENKRDFSKENTLSYFKPSELLYDILKLHPSEYDGKYLNRMCEIVCVDPSVDGKENSSLLVHKDELLNALDENSLDVFWTILGEKDICQKDDDEYIDSQVISGIAYFDRTKKKIKTEMNFFKR